MLPAPFAAYVGIPVGRSKPQLDPTCVMLPPLATRAVDPKSVLDHGSRPRRMAQGLSPKRRAQTGLSLLLARNQAPKRQCPTESGAPEPQVDAL